MFSHLFLLVVNQKRTGGISIKMARRKKDLVGIKNIRGRERE